MRRIPLLPTALGAATLLVLLVFFGIVRRNVQEMRSLRDQTALIEHTLQVQRELDGVLLQASEIDSAARGYLLSGGDISPPEYRQGKALLDTRLDRLDALTRADSGQQQRVARLRAAVSSRLSGLDAVMEIRRTRGLEAAMGDPRASKAGRWRADIRSIAAELEREEASLLVSRRNHADRAYVRAVNGRVGSGIVSAVLLVGIVLSYLLYGRARQKREIQLIESEHRAREAVAREQEARADAEQANRLKDEFLAVLSHELRTPLNAVLGWAQIVQAANPDDPTIIRALASIKRNAEAQQRLVEDLLDVSRIVSGKFPLERRQFELRSTIGAAVEAIRPAAAVKNIHLLVSLDGTAKVDGDPDRIQQVATNLLSNAVKFTPAGGKIEVRLARTDRAAELTVHDSGEGIPPELQPHIFDRFRQGDGSSTRAHGGLGLGLAIAKHIVDAHGGTIAASSEGKGRGATFSVRLPAH